MHGRDRLFGIRSHVFTFHTNFSNNSATRYIIIHNLNEPVVANFRNANPELHGDLRQ